MSRFFGPGLWPPDTRNPYRLMGIAILIAPLIVAAAITVVRVMVSAVSGLSGAELYEAVALSVKDALFMTFAFTATFGLAGVAFLWALRIRSVVVWAFLGGVCGFLAGLVAGASNPTEYGAAVLFGWLMFLTYRWLARVKD